MNIRKTIFWAHLAVGITIGAVILFLSVTGMVLSFRPQIVNWAEHGQYQTVEQQKNSPVRVFMKKIEGLHRWFGAEGALKPIIRNTKGVFVGAFLVMLVSGMYLWLPRKTMKLNKAVQGQARDWNRHNVFGFWSMPVLIIIAITGMLITYLPPIPKTPAGQADTPMRKFKNLVEHTHTGEVGGIVGQIIVFTAAGGAIVLVCTGYAMASRRFFKQQKKKESYV